MFYSTVANMHVKLTASLFPIPRTQGWFFKKPKEIDVRLGYDLCLEEKNFLQRRKKVVSAALNGILHLGQNLPESEVSGTEEL